jgi:hypothetical protein
MGDDMGQVTVQIYGVQGQRGPGKVINNLISGLSKLGVTSTFNQPPIPNTKKISLSYHNIMNTHLSELFIGPNVCVLPVDMPIVMNQQYNKYLVNSDWTYNAYNRWLPDNKLAIWPVGIDSDLFSDKSNFNKTNDCLIYFKRRDRNELEEVVNFLKTKNQSFEVIEYGSYDEPHFIKTIENSKYSIVIDNCESQGIAIQEMMSCNLPLLVWDVTHWDDRGEDFKVEASSAPYWSDNCGLKVFDLETLKQNHDTFISKLKKYNPREYIIENLTLEKGAQKLLDIINI